MSVSGHSQWRKLDNAALAFPAVTGKNDTRVFRFYCKLKEDINGEFLQEALEQTIRKYPLYQAVLRKGLFWFYLEQRAIPATVKMEDRLPCSKIYIPDKKSLLFQVSYEKKRINFEVFHALTDGTGAMKFLKELVKNYLICAHTNVQFPELPDEEEATGKDQEEDSFSQYYSEKIPRLKEKKETAARIPGRRLPQEEMHITEAVISVKETLEKSRKYGVSLTVFLTAVMLCAIHEEMPREKMGKWISLMVPVNLRNYFPSQSMTNFFGWIEVGYHFQEQTTFEDVLSDVKSQFTKELTKERVGMRMNDWVRLEKNFFLRIVPLELKTLFLQIGANFGGKSITAVFSNIGVIRMPKAYEDYIERFGIFTSTGGFQLCTCSFKDQLVLGFTSKIPSTNIERNFFNILRQQGVACAEEENEFPGYKREQKETGKKIFQIFSFLCIALAVVSGMIDYILDGAVSYAGFVASGCFCTWLVVAVGYKKRRNLLKNSMWQLILISVIAFLWDYYTGYQGWAADFVIPLASIAVLCSVPVIAKIRHLEQEEYLFYFVQISVFGMLPFLLLLLGVVKRSYPSVICSGVSFLSLIWIMIFRGKELSQEVHKKFRM